MAWLQISLIAYQNEVEAYSDSLMAAGAVSITLEDAEDNPLFEPKPGDTPLWPKTRIVGLFDSTIEVSQIKNFLENQLSTSVLQTLELKPLAEKNWIRAWMDTFHPMRFGKKLWICPSFEKPPDPTAINIMLDPGMAFGTGAHPTTRLCLEWLDANPPQNAIVVDYGCGSGILGIAALKLGASFVYAVDHDSQALQSTQDNAKQNGVDAIHMVTLLPEQFKLTQKVDLLLANILANPLIELAPTFANLVRTNGMLVLSGILDNQIDAILDCYYPWFNQIAAHHQEGWALLSFVRLP